MEKGKAPVSVQLEKGIKYSWCTCGMSDERVFCDGSHRGTDYEPVRFEVEESKKYSLCTCKLTKNPPFCDGSHK